MWLTIPRRSDVALAALVVVASELPLLVPTPRPWWVLGCGLLASVPVAWRRSATAATALVVGAATTVLALAVAPTTGLWLPYGMLVCTYTVASQAEAAWRSAGLLLGTAGLVVTLALPHEGMETFRSVIAEYVAVYAVGVSTRARQAQRGAEQERARRLEQERAGAVERERTRIARDMHDVVTHSVGLMLVQAEAGPLIVRSDPAWAEATFEAIAQTGRDAIGQLRQILGSLRGGDGTLLQPGIPAIPELVDQARRADVDVSLSSQGRRRPIPAEVGVAAYRVVQESLTNALRHAAARTVRVGLAWTDHALVVEVADDGGGTGDLREGHGLIGMRERVRAGGGRLDLDPRGFTVRATFPFAPAEAE